MFYQLSVHTVHPLVFLSAAAAAAAAGIDAAF